jgi:methylmalonyl-CoA mutase cobalamin-binding subunit
MNAAHEHFFLAAVKMFLGEVAQQFAPGPDAPVLISATPSGQHHELGAFMAAISALHFGWNAIYLGASLPAADIAGACLQTDAVAVVLSVIYPTDDPRLPGEIRMLRAALPKGPAIVLGGRAAASYRPSLKGANPIFVSDLADMAGVLDALRSGRPRTQRS